MEQELVNMKKQIKYNINYLINNKKLDESLAIIDQYFKRVSLDPEMYCMKLIITMMKGLTLDSENMLKNVLESEPYDEKLLLNLSYLMDKKKEGKQALEYFCKAKLFNSDSEVKAKDIITNREPKDQTLKVIQGTIEIANQMNIVTEGLKKFGVSAKSLNYYPNYLGYKSDYVFDINLFRDINEVNIETKKLASKLIGENDVFHFHFGTSLTVDYSDLKLLNDLNKKVIMQYWGSDVRMYTKAIKMNPYVKVKDMDEDGIKRRLELISKYISNCIVDYELAEYVKDYHSKIYYTKVAIDLKKYNFIESNNKKKLLIVHAPTSPEFKGTNFILKAIEELKLNYDFEFKLIQGMQHEQAFKIYEQADLIIDQILTGGYGVFAVEAMAMGKPVICWISDFMKEKYPKELPIISANPDNIKQKIEYIINNKDVLKDVGIKSRRYVEKHHDMDPISKNILAIYNEI